MKIRTLPVLTAVLLTAVTMFAQQRQFQMQAPQGERLMLPGLILYFADHDASGEVKLSAVMNFAQQGGGEPTAYSDLDIEKGDVLMMMDAMPVPSAGEFIKHYESAQVGAEISLGLRGESGDVKVVSFKKPDPSELPQMRTINASDLTPEQLKELKETGKLMIKREAPKKTEEKTPPPGGLR